jgi:hypothetical protein
VGFCVGRTSTIEGSGLRIQKPFPRFPFQWSKRHFLGLLSKMSALDTGLNAMKSHFQASEVGKFSAILPNSEKRALESEVT